MTLSSLTDLINDEADRFQLPLSPSGLYQPISYILALGGKRIRPVLTLIGYSLFKDDPERISREALSVEVFHNFTLMHDDIMDKAPLRRGEQTVHEKWNQTTAILSGDAMLIKAYQLIEKLEPELLAQSFKLFNKCALEVCEGQQLDMEMEDSESATVNEYLEMIRLKTAVLLGYSLQFGGLLAGQDDKTQTDLHQIGMNMGLAFQLMDDHLDTFGNESFGKKIGGDILANKRTFLLISALESSCSEEIRTWLTREPNDEKIQNMTRLFREAGVEEISKQRINHFGNKAKSLLDDIQGDDAAKKILGDYIALLNERVS